ncbi:MAG: hypothetical protein V2I33_25220 [Kangiellaceae bacterium]|jgi:hypothetical protein|nr:hypothetical protein [Kangiellaceae bacterium]
MKERYHADMTKLLGEDGEDMADLFSETKGDSEGLNNLIKEPKTDL